MSDRRFALYVLVFILVFIVFFSMTGLGAGILSFIAGRSHFAQDDYFQKEAETQRKENREQREKISKQDEENWQLQQKLNAAEWDLERAKVEHAVLNAIVNDHKEELMPRNYSSFRTTIYLNGRRGVLCSYKDYDTQCFIDPDN